MFDRMVDYLARLATPQIILWCYLSWYASMVILYFDPSPALWLSSLGMSLIIGLALILSTSDGKRKPELWVVLRLFLIPFCVSSYSALIKGHGFFFIFSPKLKYNVICAASCLAVCLLQKFCAFFRSK